MKKLLVVLLLLTAAVSGGFAQSRTIRGTVISQDDGQPIIGAAVQVKGTKIGVLTDIDGQYTLQVPERGKTLVVSYLGYTTKDVAVGPNLKIFLSADAQTLDEVVVAYGSQQRRNLTGAVGSVDGKELLKNPVTGVEQSLAGKFSGVQVLEATGAPGGAVTINVRGTSSVSAGNEPLYVVDGLPVVSKDLSDVGGYQGNQLSGIADINPSDIASIEVLKDASAAALYGSRASNGVILITTKKGTSGRTQVTLDSYVGWQDIAHKLKFLNGPEYIAARNEAIDNYNTSLGLTPADATFKQHEAGAVPGADTDWFDAVTQKGLLTSHQLSVSGGNGRTQFYASAGYYRQEGAIIHSSYDRYNLRTNLGHQINDKIRLDANIALSSSLTHRITGDNNIYSPWYNMLSVSPDYVIYNPDGSYANVNNSRRNPIQLAEEDKQTSRKWRALFNVKATWIILPGLTYRLNLGGDYNVLHERQIWPATSLQGASYNGDSVDGRAFTYTHLAENTLTYDHTWGNLKFNALVGYSYQKTTLDNAYVEGINFVSPALVYIDSAAETPWGGGYVEENALQSLFGRVNLNYKNRYLLELSLRSDASSKFAPSKRVGYFPAASAAWRISDEAFFPKHGAVSDLKVRASVGYTGNQEGIGNYEYHQTYSASNIIYNGRSGYAFPTYMPNPDLTWEKTLQYDFGFDATLLNNRIDVTFDYFKKSTHDLLLTHSVNALSGYSSQTSNVGSLNNSGVELSVTSHNLTGVFKWNTTFNLTYSRNKVTELVKNAEGEEPYITTGFCNVLQVGEPMASFFMIRADGIYQSKEEILAQPGGQALWDKGIRPGDVKYFDKNEDGVINSEDRVVSGSPFPKVFGSLGNTFSFNGFDLSIDLQYSFGAKLYTAWKASAAGIGNQGGHPNGYNILKEEWDNRWTESNTSGTAPRAVANGAAYENNVLNYTTRYLEKADFLKIRNISLGYTLPQRVTSQLGISRLRFYATVHNLLTFTGYDGFDPEVTLFPDRSNYRGYDSGSVPQLRSFVFGFNLSF